LRIAGGKEVADVPEPGRAEYRVDERVSDDVPVRMAREAAIAGEVDAAEHEGRIVGKRVCVQPDPNPQVLHRLCFTGTRRILDPFGQRAARVRADRTLCV
jgi:hypothetical protein